MSTPGPFGVSNEGNSMGLTDEGGRGPRAKSPLAEDIARRKTMRRARALAPAIISTHTAAMLSAIVYPMILNSCKKIKMSRSRAIKPPIPMYGPFIFPLSQSLRRACCLLH
jgi:hypothetical protein